MEKPYRWIDHTADVGIEVYGLSLPEIYIHSAQGMFAILTDSTDIRPGQIRKINLTASNHEELLVAWLRELHYIYEVERLLFCQFEIEQLTNTTLTATVHGEPIDMKRHHILTELKTVTYHQLAIQQTDTGFMARIIFDL